MKGAVFDVDGTILDSMNIWADVTARFFRQHGLDPGGVDIAAYKEMTLDESLPLIIRNYGLDMTIEEVNKEFREMIIAEYTENIQLKPGVDEYLRRLHESGVKIAVATSGYEGICKAAFTRLNIIDYIDEYAFSSEVGVNKGQPDVYLLAARRIGVPPQECTVFEDIVLGLGSAKKAGFATCAVYDDTNAEETEVLMQLADRYITGWSELL